MRVNFYGIRGYVFLDIYPCGIYNIRSVEFAYTYLLRKMIFWYQRPLVSPGIEIYRNPSGKHSKKG